jgi:hypothetical protein
VWATAPQFCGLKILRDGVHGGADLRGFDEVGGEDRFVRTKKEKCYPTDGLQQRLLFPLSTQGPGLTRRHSKRQAANFNRA